MARQCGSRKEGGVYACCGTSPMGMPLEHFLICPPIPVDIVGLGLSEVGVKLKAREIPDTICPVCEGAKVVRALAPEPSGAASEGGELSLEPVAPQTCGACEGLGTRVVWHVFDIVGQKYYPDVMDFTEEARRLGISRRCELPSAEEYAKLSRDSRIILIHQRASIENVADYYERMDEGENKFFSCPKNHPSHGPLRHPNEGQPMCSGLWRHDLTQATPRDTGERRASRTLQCGASYKGYLRHPDIEPQYQHAIFASFPLTGLELVDPQRRYMEKAERLRKARVEAITCDE